MEQLCLQVLALTNVARDRGDVLGLTIGTPMGDDGLQDGNLVAVAVTHARLAGPDPAEFRDRNHLVEK